MKFKLWGTRGSIPSPVRTQDIENKILSSLSAAGAAGVDLGDPTAIRAFVASLPYFIRGTAGGDTACLEVRSGGNLFIFDCGSGIRQLGLELMKQEFGRGQGVAHIFITHTHWDHMMGWPFFVPGFIPGNEFRIYAAHQDIEHRFRLQQTAPSMFPVSLDFQSAKIEFVPIPKGGTIEIGRTRIRNMAFNHPGVSYGYRVEDDDGILVFATDNEYKTLDPAATQHYVDFFRDADALIFDAMFSLRESYQKEDWGHSSAVAGADLATRAGARRLLLFHHDPTYTDEEIWSLRDQAEEYLKQHPERPPCKVIVAYDGLEMELWREAKLEARSEHLPDGIAIHLNGILAEETAHIALDAIDSAVAQTKNTPLAVNLAQVVHVDQEGLKALLSARRHRRPLALAGLSPELRRTLARAGALDYFAIFDTPHSALATLRQTLHLPAGQVLANRYEIDKQLGHGPLGDLYRVSDRATNQRAVVQVLCPSLGSAPTKSLLQAAQAVTHLRHPLIAGVFDVGQDGPISYLVMEQAPGRTLRQWISAGDTSATISPDQAVHIGLQIVQALEYAHSRGIVHGALKPENVVLNQDNASIGVKVSHFGVGRIDIDKPLNELPAHMGPLDYLAPEQIQGRGNSPASDLYALGTILYELLTGAPPFAATANDEDLISLQLRQPPVPPRRRNPNLSRSLEHLLLNLLQKSPRERPNGAGIVRQVLTGLTPQSRHQPLLGRDNLRQTLRNHLERVAQGQSGLLVMHGQRGVGKSRLALSIAEPRIADQPLTTLYGELFAHQDTRPYKLFVSILRHTLLDLPAHQVTELFNKLDELAQPIKVLIPDLHPALSALAPSQTTCERLEEAICETVRLLAARGPVLLILDSLQWADAASLRTLGRLVRQKIPRLLILVVYHSKEVTQDHPLRQTLNDLEPWIDAQIYVTPLSPIDVHQMASTLSAPHRVPPDFGLWLYSETEGNPLHTEQLIQAYLEATSETHHPYERITELTVEDVILRRLERLPNDALITLRQAAVLGHTFHAGTLISVLDQPEPQVLAHLHGALQTRLIFGHPSQDRYSFSHPLIREVIYAEMLGGVRKRYYRRAARALEQKGVSGAMDEKIDLLAHQLLHAEEYDQAVAYLARATVRARKLCAYDAALNYVNQALAVVEQALKTTTKEEERARRKNQRDDLLAARKKLEKNLPAPETVQPKPDAPQQQQQN